MSDSYISYGSDGSYHIIRQIGEGFDIETAFLIALGIVAIYVMWHYSPKEVWNKIKSYFKNNSYVWILYCTYPSCSICSFYGWSYRLFNW